MTRYACTEGLVIEAVGHLWAIFCPTSGETLLLNDESCAIVEVLRDAGPARTQEVCSALSADSGIGSEQLRAHVEAVWPGLLDAGLVRTVGVDAAAPPR